MEIFDHRVSVVDMAYEIIELHEENMRLRAEVEYYKPYQQMYTDALDNSIAHSQVMIGTILKAAIDPDSIINKMHKMIALESMDADKS